MSPAEAADDDSTYARGEAPGEGESLKTLLARKAARLASIAWANKMARIAWAVLSRGEVDRKTAPLPAAV